MTKETFEDFLAREAELANLRSSSFSRYSGKYEYIESFTNICSTRQQFSECTLRVFTTGSDKLNKNMSMFEMFSKTIEVNMLKSKTVVVMIRMISRKIMKIVIRRGWSSKRWRSYWLSSGSVPAMSKSSPTCRGMQKLRWFDNINIFIIIAIVDIIVIINYGNPSKTT